MATVWFVFISLMLAAYVVLDGFDFGAGIIHLIVANTDEERRTVLQAIGPLWDGNEVWLLSAGGALFFAFPKVYASGFSGFYMPLMIVLWLLILRGLSIEFRSKLPNTLWRSFWDGLFFLSSTLLAIVLGAALGNVIRGVPLDASGYFLAPLFTNFNVGVLPGVLDWYTVLVGVFTLVVLAGHGALFLTWKTTGAVQQRSKNLSKKLWAIIVVLMAVTTVGTSATQPLFYPQMIARPWILILVLAVLGSLVSLFINLKNGKELPAFLSSVAYIAGILAATAAAAYPNLLASTINPAFSLNVSNASTDSAGLAGAMIWWVPGILTAIGYFVYLFRSFRGKVDMEAEGYGH